MSFPLGPSNLVRTLVRQRAEAVQTSYGRVVRGELGGLDRATGLVSGLRGAQVVYEGQMRVASVSESLTSRGGGEGAQRNTTVSIPFDAQVPQIDDVVIVATDNDPSVARMVLRVVAVDGGGYFNAARRLTCTGFGKSRTWQP